VAMGGELGVAIRQGALIVGLGAAGPGTLATLDALAQPTVGRGALQAASDAATAGLSPPAMTDADVVSSPPATDAGVAAEAAEIGTDAVSPVTAADMAPSPPATITDAGVAAWAGWAGRCIARNQPPISGRGTSGSLCEERSLPARRAANAARIAYSRRLASSAAGDNCPSIAPCHSPLR
jgi:hypothetical protein